MRKSKYPESPKTFGEIIRKKRMDLGLSLLDMKNKTHLSEGYLSRIEADKQMPTPEVAEAIAEALQEDIAVYVPFLLKKYFREDSPIHKFNDQTNKMILQKNENDKKVTHKINETEMAIANIEKITEDAKKYILELPIDEGKKKKHIETLTNQKSASVIAELKNELTKLKSAHAELETAHTKLLETANFMNDIKERARKKSKNKS